MFDIVLMRQGLCYCQDNSFDCPPAKKLIFSGINVERGDISDGPSGIYSLEPNIRNGRPFYRKSGFVLHWRPRSDCASSGDWAVVEDNETSYVWANVCKNSGSPALAQEPWHVWNGKDFVIDKGISCDVVGSCPWRRPPSACRCCAGIPLDSLAIQSFIGRVARVLDAQNPKAFAFLQSGFYKGIPDEVEDFYFEVEMAAERFDSSQSHMCASVLRRQESRDTEEDPTRYWNHIDGLMLSVRLA